MTGTASSPSRTDERIVEALPIGVNTFVWHSPITDETLHTTLEKIASWGYEGVEIATENLADWDPDRARQTLDSLGLRGVVGGVFGPGRELTCAAPGVIEETQGYVRGAIDLAARVGAPLVIGPMYTSVGRTWRMSPDERRTAITTLRESYRPLVDHAASRSVRLAIEPLNRYETSLLTTAEQVMDAIDPLPREVIGVNLDSYHMNIEEGDLGAAFDVVGDRLLHMQVCGNDRGAPGDDHIDWPAVRSGLERVGYRGMLGFESFTADNASIATAASIWRSFAPSQDDLARRALENLQRWRRPWNLG
ncbi:sugar phosphate isomerase/epimerase [Microlunatus sp. Gsoil 973]|uniref:sugar phosphate isomerase/epimerase family protein n=1 Tax=Microlunatus sp. Gsoil 973 TaxID=2672569 RepID=UPI001E60DB7E|nr:sugar phosphate isomerase/epimerase [Microlunatus sp. Gsoil 973]